jgi:hypothetical protein
MNLFLVGQKIVPAPLYIDDELLAEIVLGEKVKLWSTVRTMLQREGMPPAKRAMGGLYYLPAQLRFLDRREGLRSRHDHEYAEDGPPDFGA